MESVGRMGEDMAAEYLADRGHKIVGRNIRQKFGEIDILTRDAAGVLHFVEVKTLTFGFVDFSGLSPEDNLTRAKLAKLRRFAEWHVGQEEAGEFQIDLLAVVLDLAEKRPPEFRLYENIG